MKRLLDIDDDMNHMCQGLATRMSAAESAIGTLQSAPSNATLQTSVNSLSTRMAAAESGLSGHDTRLTALESGPSSFASWKTAKPAKLTKLNYTVSAIGLTVLGLTVAGADKVKDLADKVDALIDLCSARSVTA